MSIDLASVGYDAWFEERFTAVAGPGEVPGRVAVQQRGRFTLITEAGEVHASLAGAAAHSAQGAGALPAVGDFVAVALDGHGSATIRSVVDRKTAFSRKTAGLETEEQVIAANIDVVFIVMALTTDFNLRRLERYMTTAYASGAMPVILLTKADVCDDVEGMTLAAEQTAPGTRVIVVSAVTGVGVEEVGEIMGPGTTAVLLGSSGVGKSTLVNALVGEERQAVKETRDDGKGRHTTTHRQMIHLQTGGIVIDTPGMREFQMWDVEEGLDQAFDDIAELAANCRFSDCAHDTEPGCAVQAALRDGTLEQDRYASYLKLQRELEWIRTKKDKRAQSEKSKQWSKIYKEAQARTRHR